MDKKSKGVKRQKEQEINRSRESEEQGDNDGKM